MLSSWRYWKVFKDFLFSFFCEVSLNFVLNSGASLLEGLTSDSIQQLHLLWSQLSTHRAIRQKLEVFFFLNNATCISLCFFSQFFSHLLSSIHPLPFPLFRHLRLISFFFPPPPTPLIISKNLVMLWRGLNKKISF